MTGRTVAALVMTAIILCLEHAGSDVLKEGWTSTVVAIDK
jgi:hypothetical protein